MHFKIDFYLYRNDYDFTATPKMSREREATSFEVSK